MFQSTAVMTANVNPRLEFKDSARLASTPGTSRREAKSVSIGSSTRNEGEVFFSRASASVFDAALALHAAPVDDPPVWGGFDELIQGGSSGTVESVGAGNHVETKAATCHDSDLDCEKDGAGFGFGAVANGNVNNEETVEIDDHHDLYGDPYGWFAADYTTTATFGDGDEAVRGFIEPEKALEGNAWTNEHEKEIHSRFECGIEGGTADHVLCHSPECLPSDIHNTVFPSDCALSATPLEDRTATLRRESDPIRMLMGKSSCIPSEERDQVQPHYFQIERQAFHAQDDHCNGISNTRQNIDHGPGTFNNFSETTKPGYYYEFPSLKKPTFRNNEQILEPNKTDFGGKTCVRDVTASYGVGCREQQQPFLQDGKIGGLHHCPPAKIPSKHADSMKNENYVVNDDDARPSDAVDGPIFEEDIFGGGTYCDTFFLDQTNDNFPEVFRTFPKENAQVSSNKNSNETDYRCRKQFQDSDADHNLNNLVDDSVNGDRESDDRPSFDDGGYGGLGIGELFPPLTPEPQDITQYSSPEGVSENKAAIESNFLAPSYLREGQGGGCIPRQTSKVKIQLPPSKPLTVQMPSPADKLLLGSTSAMKNETNSFLMENEVPSTSSQKANELNEHNLIRNKRKNNPALTNQETDILNAKTGNNAAWKRRFIELKHFRASHGHCNVPQRYEHNPSLGAWVARQRLFLRQWEELQRWKQMEVSPVLREDCGSGSKGHCNGHILSDNDEEAVGSQALIDKRMKLLQDIGLDSSIGKGAFGKKHGLLLTSRNAKIWDKQFEELRRYRDEFGHCDVPVKYEKNLTLGRWVTAQRKKFRQFCTMKEGKIEQHGGSIELRSRFQRLKELGFNFAIGSGNAKRTKSVASTDARTVVTPTTLRATFSNCVEELSVISQSTSDDSSPGIISCTPTPTKPKRCITETDLKVKQSFHLPPPSDMITNHFHSGYPNPPIEGIKENACPSQNTLNTFRQSLSFFDPRDERGAQLSASNPAQPDWGIGNSRKYRGNSNISWDKRWSQLVSFKNLHGHTLVPQVFQEDRTFGKWVSKQREAYQRYLHGKPTFMKEYHILKLKSIGFQFVVGKGKHKKN